jgi:hypothetical protein
MVRPVLMNMSMISCPQSRRAPPCQIQRHVRLHQIRARIQTQHHPLYNSGQFWRSKRIATPTSKCSRTPHPRQSPEAHPPSPPQAMNTLALPRWLSSHILVAQSSGDLLRDGYPRPFFANDTPHRSHDTFIRSHRNNSLHIQRTFSSLSRG